MGYFICLLLVAFGAHTCMAQSKVMEQVSKLMADMDQAVKTAEADAKKYETELQKFTKHLSANATSNSAILSNAQENFIATIKRNLNELVEAAEGIDVTECIDMVIPVVSTAIGILENGAHCIREELEQTHEEFRMLFPYIETQLNALRHFYSSAEYCSTRYTYSNQSPSDAAEAIACIRPLHKSTKLTASRFKSIVDVSLAKYLFEVYEARVTKCAATSMENLYWFYTPADSVGEDIFDCVVDMVEYHSSK